MNSVAAAAVALPLWSAAALAQDAQAPAEGTDQAEQTDQAQQTGDAGAAPEGQQAQQGGGADVLIATVGDAEIRNSDLMRAIGALPPPLNAQPPEMVVPIALQQLFVREAIVQEARSQGLDQDPQVQSLVEGATQAAEEDALVQVWLQRELSNRVTPEAVDQAYAGLEAVAADQPVPPLEQIRPQIEQALARRAMEEIQASLISDAQITLYGPDGQPMDPQQGDAGGQADGNAQANTGDVGGEGQQGTAGDQAQAEQTAAGDQPTTIRATETEEHGQYLVDGDGRAVYMFTADTQGQGDAEPAVSNCYDACAEAWPPVLAQGSVLIGETLMLELFGAIERQDGSLQVTYNGWPLYYFVRDQGAGQATGQDVESHGGEWYLLRPSGERVGHE